MTERVSLAGIPIELVDTAGLRQATDEAERLGIEKSREALAEADLVVVVLDADALFNSPPAPAAGRTETPRAGQVFPGDLGDLLQSLEARRAILVLNKCDLLRGETRSIDVLSRGPSEPHGREASAMQAPAAAASSGVPTTVDHALAVLQQELLQILGHQSHLPLVATSARDGSGLAALREAIEGQLQAPAAGEQTGMLTNLRQHQAVEAAQAALQAARSAAHLPHEMILLDLYTSLRHLDALTGETTADDILHLIFSTFCIGK